MRAIEHGLLRQNPRLSKGTSRGELLRRFRIGVYGVCERGGDSAAEGNQGSRGIAFHRPAGARFRERTFSRALRGGLGDAVSADPGGATGGAGQIARGNPRVSGRASRSGRDRSQCRYPASFDRWARSDGRARDDGAEGIWWPRIFAKSLLQNFGRDRGAMCVDISFYERASFNRDSRIASIRDTRTKTAVAAAVGHGSTTRGIRVDGGASRVGRSKCPDNRDPKSRWLAFHSERRKTLHHERFNRARADGDGADAGPELRQDRDHRVSGHAGHAGIHDARAADGKARDSRNGNWSFCHARHGSAEGKYSRADREGIEGGADGAGFWADDVRRVLHRRSADVSAIGRRAREQAPAIQKDARRF